MLVLTTFCLVSAEDSGRDLKLIARFYDFITEIPDHPMEITDKELELASDRTKRTVAVFSRKYYDINLVNERALFDRFWQHDLVPHEAKQKIHLPFIFPFFGSHHNTITIGNDGFVFIGKVRARG